MKAINCGTTPEMIIDIKPYEVFVFGSNLAGAHGGGAAKMARKWGAKWGIGEGLRGNTYALPTMSTHLKPLSVNDIKPYVQTLYEVIKTKPQYHFYITKVGCGIAGFGISDIAPLFSDFLNLHNCSLPIEFIQLNT